MGEDEKNNAFRGRGKSPIPRWPRNPHSFVRKASSLISEDYEPFPYELVWRRPFQHWLEGSILDLCKRASGLLVSDYCTEEKKSSDTWVEWKAYQKKGGPKPLFGACNFFAYSWKLPAYSGAFLLTIDNFSFFTYNWSFFAYSFIFFTYYEPAPWQQHFSTITFHFQNCIVMTFPMINSVLDNFPPCPLPRPPEKRKFYFYCRLAFSDLQLELFCLQWESESNKGLKGLEAKKLNCKQ